MDPSDWVSLILGGGGLLIGAWGMWLTHTSRSAGFQAALHAKQLDVATLLAEAIEDLWLLALHRADALGRGQSFEYSEEFLRAEFNNVRRLLQRAGVVMPQGIVSDLSRFLTAAAGVLFGDEELAAYSSRSMSDRFADIRAALRQLTGVEPLSQKTTALLAELELKRGVPSGV